MTSITATVAAEHRADLLKAAADRRLVRRDSQPREGLASAAATIAIRPAGADEGLVLSRLAELDDAPELRGTVLLAVIDGEAVAALSLLDGRVVADPFVPTQEAVGLLRLRASFLFGNGKRRRPRSILRARFA
jgi:hypothetical protein